MAPHFLILVMLAALLKGGLSQIVLTQSDPVLKKPGESHKLACAVTGFNVNSYNMYWVRQKPGQGLEWIVYYYSSSDNSYSPTIQGWFIASKDSSNFYLQMNNLKADDTAVYYCASDTFGMVYLIHYAPAVPNLIQRQEFYKWDQKEGGSIGDFVEALGNMGDRDCPSLLGLEWFVPLGIEVTGINRITEADWEESLMWDFQDVFDRKLGKYCGSPISFNLNLNIALIRLKLSPFRPQTKDR
ncbi:uncharacterized protein LOC113451690 [Pseudonaja textilis]|uniref:uncharacterized protein LOC113451690 n=1 Tax=Pseudonaja textilis TaxID=8673 RepID=UPI000EAA066E|nr:uncharacterized protein LOC113451690 [Pseudonaja textilis]